MWEGTAGVDDDDDVLFLYACIIITTTIVVMSVFVGEEISRVIRGKEEWVGFYICCWGNGDQFYILFSLLL